MRSVRTLGLLGTGVIGGGWAARALHFGIDVIAADVKPEMEAGYAARSPTPSPRWRA
jgi:carnitine 3-dehydrogenase